jgi:DNA primase
MPVTWERLEGIYPTDFTLRTAPDLLEAEGDPWSEILASKQDLGELLEARTA